MSNRLTTMQSEFELITVIDNMETIKQQFDFYAIFIQLSTKHTICNFYVGNWKLRPNNI